VNFLQRRNRERFRFNRRVPDDLLRSIEFVGPNMDRESSARHILEGNHAMPFTMRPFYSTSTRSPSATLTDERKNFWENWFASGYE
jgi:hypothetical protein